MRNTFIARIQQLQNTLYETGGNAHIVEQSLEIPIGMIPGLAGAIHKVIIASLLTIRVEFFVAFTDSLNKTV